MPGLACFVVCLLHQLETGIAVGLLLQLAMVLYTLARPQVSPGRTGSVLRVSPGGDQGRDHPHLHQAVLEGHSPHRDHVPRRDQPQEDHHRQGREGRRPDRGGRLSPPQHRRLHNRRPGPGSALIIC